MRLVSEDSYFRNLTKFFHFNYFGECVYTKKSVTSRQNSNWLNWAKKRPKPSPKKSTPPPVVTNMSYDDGHWSGARSGLLCHRQHCLWQGEPCRESQYHECYRILQIIITVSKNITNKIFKISQMKCFKYAPFETGDHRSRCYPQAGQTCPHPRWLVEVPKTPQLLKNNL